VNLQLPSGALIVLIGPSGSGKSTFAARHFVPSEILSSDAMRGMVADDPNDQSATEAAFELLHAALGLRMARGRLTVVDATNVERWARERLLAIARRYRRAAAAVVLDLPLEVCLERNAARSDRRVPTAAVRRQQAAMRASVEGLEEEGFQTAWRFSSEEAVSGATVERAIGEA
jgi:protein phosphatase